MSIRLLSAQDVLQALPMRDAITASREAFLALAAGEVNAPPRVHLMGSGADGRVETTLLMAASGPVGRVTKVVSIFPGNAERGLATTSGLVTMLDPESGHPLGLCDGGALTAVRTGAVAGLAADLLARPDAKVVAVFGAGSQAETQAVALAIVRPLEQLRVYSRTPERRCAFAERLKTVHGIPAVPVASPSDAVRGADVVAVATNSSQPVFAGANLDAGTHVSGVGSFRPSMRELDEETIRRADRIVVDLRASALHEAGELIAADRAGVSGPDCWVELGALLRDRGLGRRHAGEVTLFKSVGHAVQDLYAARCAFDRAEACGIGQLVDL